MVRLRRLGAGLVAAALGLGPAPLGPVLVLGAASMGAVAVADEDPGDGSADDGTSDAASADASADTSGTDDATGDATSADTASADTSSTDDASNDGPSDTSSTDDASFDPTSTDTSSTDDANDAASADTSSTNDATPATTDGTATAETDVDAVSPTNLAEGSRDAVGTGDAGFSFDADVEAAIADAPMASVDLAVLDTEGLVLQDPVVGSPDRDIELPSADDPAPAAVPTASPATAAPVLALGPDAAIAGSALDLAVVDIGALAGGALVLVSPAAKAAAPAVAAAPDTTVERVPSGFVFGGAPRAAAPEPGLAAVNLDALPTAGLVVAAVAAVPAPAATVATVAPAAQPVPPPSLPAAIGASPRPAPPPTPWSDGGESRPQEIVVADLAERLVPVLRSRGYVVMQRSRQPALGLSSVRLEIPPGRSLSSARAEVASLTGSDLVDANHLFAPMADLAPAELREAMSRVAWPGPLPRLTACPGAPAIGMIDTGVDLRHPAFRGRALQVVDAPGGSERRPSSSAHGTAVAALLVGDPDSPTPGLLPAAELLVADPFTRHGAGGDRADAFALAQALDRLVARGVGVVNLSFAGPPNRLVEAAIRAAERQGVVFVAAAGNGGPGAPPAYPAAYPEVIAVTAVDADDRPFRRAQRGAYVAFAAPGVGLPTADPADGVRRQSGTSFSAPFVTAAAHLIKAEQRGAHGRDVAEILARAARDLGPPGPDPIFGYGLVQAVGGCGPR